MPTSLAGPRAAISVPALICVPRLSLKKMIKFEDSAQALGEYTSLTEKVRQREDDAWRWVTGERPLQERGAFHLVLESEFPRINRPHVAPEPTSSEMDTLREMGKLDVLTEGYRRAREAGVTPAQARAAVSTLVSMEGRWDMARQLRNKLEAGDSLNPEPFQIYGSSTTEQDTEAPTQGASDGQR